jgi:8-oxo-dGTP pyrophosphatase MutT (NUDIX family)
MVHNLALAVLVLPDTRVVLQRRSQNPAITAPGKLGLFGGHIEPGESSLEAVQRELHEETSLSFDPAQLEHLMHYELTAEQTGRDDMQYELYLLPIEHDDFKVFEGDGAEAYSAEAALQRDDLSLVTRYVLEQLRERLSA